MSDFRKTRIMNIIGASGIATLCVVLLLNKMRVQPLGVLASIVTGSGCRLLEV
jgi:hypothetical protein